MRCIRSLFSSDHAQQQSQFQKKINTLTSKITVGGVKERLKSTHIKSMVQFSVLTVKK